MLTDSAQQQKLDFAGKAIQNKDYKALDECGCALVEAYNPELMEPLLNIARHLAMEPTSRFRAYYIASHVFGEAPAGSDARQRAGAQLLSLLDSIPDRDKIEAAQRLYLLTLDGSELKERARETLEALAAKNRNKRGTALLVSTPKPG